MAQGPKGLADVHRAEQDKWDSLVPPRVPENHVVPRDVTFESVANRSSLLRGIPEFLGPLKGKRLLEYGCGLGELTVLLAKSGAEVTAFDISSRSVAYTRQRAAANGISIETACAAAAESLPFADETFDIALGKAILHHIDPALGSSELCRVMKPAARAVFSEPLGMNPLLNMARGHLWYPKKHVRGEDKPLTTTDIETWSRGFQDVRMEWIQLLSMLERGFGFKREFPLLRRMDRFLLGRVPALRRYCRYVILFWIK